MAIFKRRKNQTVAELEEYYASKQTRTGMAWVMAVVSLVITILVVSALFFGGRWIYRSFTDDNLQVTVSENNGTDSRADGFGDSEEESETGENFPSVVSDEAASTTTPSSSNPVASAPSVPTTPSTPATGGSNIPNTGPGEVLIIAPLVTMIAGYLISRKYQLQNK